MTHVTQVPGAFCGLPESSISEGFLSSFSPRSFISKTPISLVDPKRFLPALSILNEVLRSPSKYRTQSTICSRTFGPAMLPSLLICPITNVVKPFSFVRRIIDIVHSRTWLMLPGAELTSASNMVCIESIITISGDRASTFSITSASPVSAKTYISPLSTPSL